MYDDKQNIFSNLTNSSCVLPSHKSFAFTLYVTFTPAFMIIFFLQLCTVSVQNMIQYCLVLDSTFAYIFYCMASLCEMFSVINFIVVLWLFSCSLSSDSATPWTAVGQASLSFTISRNLFKLMCILQVMPSNHLILFHLQSAFNLSQHQGLFR